MGSYGVTGETLYTDITALDSLEAYEALTKEELQERQAKVSNYFSLLAVNYSSKRKSATNYLLEEVDEFTKAGNYSNYDDSKKHQEIRLARKLVEVDELCGTVLDRMISFAITQGTIENVKNKDCLDLLNRWRTNVNNIQSTNKDEQSFVTKPHGISIVFSQILERLFTDGDAIVSEVWTKDSVIRDSKYILPYKINIHDTLLVEMDEESFSKTGNEKLYLNTSKPFGKYGSSKKEEDRIPLFTPDADPFTAHIKLRGKTFSKWGTSYFKRAFQPIASKKRIEALEINTIDGLINRLTIIKAGTIDAETESGIIAPHRLAALEQLISQPKVNNLILWPGDDISVEDIGPKEELVTYEKKYVETNAQTLSALGFPRVLVDGEGSRGENWQKFLGLISFLESVRMTMLVPWMTNILTKIAEANGFTDEEPRFSFSRLKLYDLKDLLNAVKVFYDRGLMSELSALVSGDLDYEIEMSRREVEAKEGIITRFGGPNALPFSKNTPDGNNKEGLTNPTRGVDKETKVAASVRDVNKTDIIKSFEEYLYVLHDSYSKKVIALTASKNFDGIAPLLAGYRLLFKQDIKRQMDTLFYLELNGERLPDDLKVAAVKWIDVFSDRLMDDIQVEVDSVISNNKDNRYAVLPDLIAGVMEAFKSKRLRLYSSAVYNKAVMAAELTRAKQEGKSSYIWKSALTERTCEFCATMHNKVLPLDVFFGEYPPHANCECWGESSTSVDYDDKAIKDPNNWGKIRK